MKIWKLKYRFWWRDTWATTRTDMTQAKISAKHIFNTDIGVIQKGKTMNMDENL